MRQRWVQSGRPSARGRSTKGRWGLAAMALACACGSSDDGGSPQSPQTTPVTIAFLEHENPTYTMANAAAFAAYMKAHANVTVKVTTLQYSTVTASLNSDLKTDKLPYDLLQVPPSWVCSFAQNLSDVPADVLPVSAAQQAFFAAPLAGSTCDGRLKGLPLEYNLEYGGVVVNVDKYQAKFPGKTPAWADWASFIADASALTEYDMAGVPKANGLDIDPAWAQPTKHIFFSQILQRGGQYWAPGNTTFNFNTTEARDSLTDMVSWLTKDRVMFPSLVPDTRTFVIYRLLGGATGYGWNDLDKPLSIMGYAGTWALAATISLLPKGNTTHFDFFPVPPMVGTAHKFVQNSGWAFAVPKTSKNAAVAWDIAKAIALSPEAMKAWAATTGSLPALRVNGSAEAAAKDPLLAKVQPLLEVGQWVGYVPAGAIETVEGAILSNYFAAAAGTKTIDQALADMERTANDAIARTP